MYSRLDVFVENAETNAMQFQVRQKERLSFRGYHNIQFSAKSSWFIPEVEAWTVAEFL